MNKTLIDWIYLPEGTEAISLWESLHDGYLQTIHSNRLMRTVDVTLKMPHLVEFHHLPEDHTFTLSFAAVSSVRCNAFAVWPGEFAGPPNATREERSKAIREFKQKGRMQSVDWGTFEQSLSDVDSYVLLMDAVLAQTEDASVLKFEGYLNDEEWDEEWYECFIHAASLAIYDSDGKSYDLHQFLQLGEKYWEAH